MMNNTKSSMKTLSQRIQLNWILSSLINLKSNSEENVLPEHGLYRYLYQQREQHGDKKDELLTLSGVKTHTN